MSNPYGLHNLSTFDRRPDPDRNAQTFDYSRDPQRQVNRMNLETIALTREELAELLKRLEETE